MNGRLIIESSTHEGVLEVIDKIERQFRHVSATIPALTHDGKYISAVHYSNNTKTRDTQSNVASNQDRIL